MAGLPAKYYRNYTVDDTVYNNSSGSLTGTPSNSIESLGWDAPTGYIFKEWNTKKDGTGIGHQPGDPASEIQYAIWEKIPPVKYLTTDQSLTAVADAIREKGGTSAQLVYPAGFVSAIDAIQTGTDVSDTTATAADVLSGKYFYNASGTKTQGSITSKTSSDLTSNGATVTVPAGHYASAASKTVASGSATTPATTITTAPNISINASGLITATNSKTQSVTPSVSAGYVSTGTAGTITVNGSNTSQLATQGAQTITPGTTDQIIQSGRYLTGTQTIKGDVNLVAANIAKNTTIFGVTGTYAGGATVTDTTDSHGGIIRNISTENVTTIESLSVAANGTYTAPSGKAYNPVTVNVNGSGRLNISGHKYFSIPFSYIPMESGATNQIQLEGSNEDITLLSTLISSDEYVHYMGGGYAQNSDGISFIYIDPNTQVAGSHIDLSWANVNTLSSNFDTIDLSLNAATKILYISHNGENFGLEGDIDILDGSIIVDLSEYET